MTDFPASYPPDEPVIGAATPPPPSRPQPPAGPFEQPQEWDNGDGYDYADDEGYADEYGERGRGIGYGGYGYNDTPPVRQPMFYVFLGLAALVGAAAIFLLVMVFRDNGKKNDAGTPAAGASAATAFNVSLNSPRAGDRVPTASSQEVQVSATATEQIVRFELYVNDQMKDQVPAGQPDAQQVYAATLHTTFDRRGDYSLYVRVVSANGGSQKSSVVKVTAVEDVGVRPKEIHGRVIAAATLRSGPGDNFADAGTVNPPLDVVVAAKSADGLWLLVTVSGPQWVKAIALDVPDIALVPVQQPGGAPTPLPVITSTTTAPVSPTATGTGTSSPSATATPAPAPDFVPTNAVVTAGGTKLRVTVTNIAPTAYSGQLVVAVTGDVLADTRAFNVSIPANNGKVDLDFDLGQAVTQQGKKAVITVNPDKNPRELNYDNNSATFVLAVQVEAPVIAIAAVAGPNQVTVTITDTGGPFAAQGARLAISVETPDGSARTEKAVDLAVTRLAPQVVIVARPQGNGLATVELTVGGQRVATTTVQLPP